ncbi:MAG: hypothetical protein ACRCW9_10060 [Cetobacterium sp.]
MNEILKLLTKNYNLDILNKLKIMNEYFLELTNESLYEYINEEIKFYYGEENHNDLEIWFISGVNLLIKELIIYLIKMSEDNKLEELKILSGDKLIHKTLIDNELKFFIGNRLDNIIFKSNNFEDLIRMI